MVRDGRVVTPRRTDGILESITRRTLIELFAENLGMETEERAIDRTELYAAEELFYCGSGWEVRPVTSVDRLPVGDGSVGPITRRITDRYLTVVRGDDADRRGWLTPVW
jgi:branched-chain amino acid aminotransferase